MSNSADVDYAFEKRIERRPELKAEMLELWEEIYGALEWDFRQSEHRCKVGRCQRVSGHAQKHCYYDENYEAVEW